MSNPECLNDTEGKAMVEENPSSGATTKEGGKIDESDEDVPGDFFDDFLKEDFMAGLDIVDDDEWDDVKIKIDTEDMVKKRGDVDVSLIKEKKEILKKRKRQKVSSNDNEASEKKERHSKQKKKKDIDKPKRTSDKQIDADEFDIRRDPEKTKRDIARDKVRCEKDKEMKIISEKLSMVETGLVPPGMEMELDIEEVKRQKEKLEVKSPRDLREHLRDLKERNRSPELKVRNRSVEHARDPKDRNRSPDRVRDLKERDRSPVQRQRSPLRRRSLPRRSPLLLKRTSPLLRKRSRSPRPRDTATIRSAISPKRSPRKSPLRRISPRRSSPRPRSSERVYARRRSRSQSPYYRSRRARYSPHRHRNRSSSRESDREKWLKNRNRSRSPRRKREEKKKSFLQEIAEKLNEIRQPAMPPPLQPMPQMQPMLQPMAPALHYIQTQPVPVPAPAPVPVPPPENVPLFPTPQQLYDPYDQNFFIGTPSLPNNFPLQSQPSPIPVGPQMPLNPVSILTAEGAPIIAPRVSTPNSNNFVPKKLDFTNKNQLRQKLESQEDVEKLFQDKQITLSEFLAITAKPEVFSSSPKHLQEKIKVITRCHDAIKFLSSCENKYSGKLVVNKTDKYKVSTSGNNSPLMRIPQVLFPFTDPRVSANEKKNSFNTFINDLLQKLGLLKNDVVNIDDEDIPEIVDEANNQIKFSPPPPPMITPIKNPFPKESKQVQYNIKKDQLCKMVQTDVFKCETCEKRKKILYRTSSMQVDPLPATFSVSTQVTEEDFQPKIPKTQSLAALTPAQLLAKSRESLSAATRASRMDLDTFDIFAPGQNRSNFFRPMEGFGLSRPALPPYSNSSLMYDSLNHQMLGGGGRGREPMVPRSLDPRYSYNNFY